MIYNQYCSKKNTKQQTKFKPCGHYSGLGIRKYCWLFFFFVFYFFLRRNIQQVAVIIPYIVYRKQNLRKSFQRTTDVFQSCHLKTAQTRSCEFEKRSKFDAAIIEKRRATLDNFTRIESWQAHLLFSFALFLRFYPYSQFSSM